MPGDYPANIEKFLAECRQQGLYIESATDKEELTKITALAQDHGLKLLVESPTLQGEIVRRGFVLFDLSDKSKKGYVLRSNEDFYTNNEASLTTTQQDQLNKTFKTLEDLIGDHHLSEKDRKTIGALRTQLEADGVTITLVQKPHEDCYVGISMGRTAKVAHAKLQ